MAVFVLKIAFLGIAALVGAVAGWWMRDSGIVMPKPSPLAPPPSPPVEPPPSSVVVEDAKPVPSYEAVEVLMNQLQQLTASVAAGVGQHNTRVQEINAELAAAGDGQPNVLAVIEKLVKANESMQSQLAQAETRLQDQAHEIESHVREARTDALTKLWNRRHFDDEMQKCTAAFRQDGRPVCVMMLDVDHFKKFNDTYGHQAGDEVLRSVGRILRQNLTSKEIVCRYGGEEFAVIFPGTDLAQAMQPAERARAAIAAQVLQFEGLDLRVTASGGLAQLQPEEAAAALVKRADTALYVCKEAGRNCGHWHDGQTSHPLHLIAPPPAARDAQLFALDEEEHNEDPRDRISGLSDHRTFVADVERRLAEWKRGGAPLSVVLIEVDDYTAITAQHGEKAAEVVLRATAQFLKAAMREMDHIARYREHVFGLLLPGAGLVDAGVIAERLRMAISRCNLPLNEQRLQFTVSVGATQAHGNQEADDLLAGAQLALDKSRVAGGNRCYANDDHGALSPLSLQSLT